MDKLDNINIIDAHHVSSERNMLTVIKGGGILFLGKLFSAASRFVIVILLARILNVEQYGLYNLAISATTLATGLALLGLDAALVRYVAIAASRRDEAKLWGALQIGIGLSTFTGVLTSTGLFALAYPISTRIFHEPGLAPLLQLSSFIVPLLILSEVLTGATWGFKKMQYSVIAQDITQPLVRLILVVVLSLIGLDAVRAILIFGFSDGVASLLLLKFLNDQFSLKRPINLEGVEIKTILNFSLPVWLSDLMRIFRSNIQTLFLGSLSTIANVGIFSVVTHVNSVGSMLFSSIATSARPMIAELHDRNDREQMGHLFQTATKWVLTINLPIFLIMVLFPTAILSIFGKSFIEGADALVILAWANLVNIGTGICAPYLEMTGYTRLKLVNTLIRLISSVIFNLWLIPHWGIVGAAVAALLVEIIVNSISLLEVWILFRLLPYNKEVLNPIIAGLVAFAAVFGLNQLFPVQANPFYVFISLLTMFAVYLGVILRLGLAPEERILLSRLQQRASAMFLSIRS